MLQRDLKSAGLQKDLRSAMVAWAQRDPKGQLFLDSLNEEYTVNGFLLFCQANMKL